MRARRDLTGLPFGRLTALTRVPESGLSRWICDCACGTTGIIVLASNLLRGNNTQSCGCLRKEVTTRRMYKHGMANTPEHKTWWNMRHRCLEPENHTYPRYGGRGITICDSWKDSFEQFFSDMGPRPSPKHTLERKNNSLGYSKDNCVWETRQVQVRNMRSNRLLTYNGKTQCIAAWTEELRLPQCLISSRLQRGWSIERTLTTPVQTQYRGKPHT